MPTGERVTLPVGRDAPAGGVPLLLPFVRDGEVIRESDMAQARDRVFRAIRAVSGEREKD